MNSPAFIQLRELQQALYERAYKEAHGIVAGNSRTILAYSAKFQKSLPGRFQRATQGDMLEQIKRHRFLLYGDFHTLRQSQRGLLRLLRAFVDRQRTGKLVIALEMFKAVDQDSLDGYLAGALSDDDFLATINYATEWGFPWQNFRMILDFAKARKLPVIGINTENAGRDRLLERDRFAAKRLVWAAEKYPDHKIVCLIGEYHLADGHLPKQLQQEARRRGCVGQTLRVLNNVDQYYFQISRQSAHKSTEYLKLKKSFYCIMNSPPWMKWQSFSIWEEMRHAGALAGMDRDADFASDLDLYAEESFDVDYQFLHFVKHLAAFMSLTIDASDMESFHIHYSPDGDFRQSLRDSDGIAAADANRMIGRVLTDGAYFNARNSTVLLADISINNLAEAAGQYLHGLLTGFEDHTGNAAEDFFRRILKSAVGMIASKILNPRRKCLELHHLRTMVRRHRQRSLSDTALLRLQTATAILRFDRWITMRLAAANPSYATPPRGIVQVDLDTNYEVSRGIGQMLGLTLYKKVIANKEAPSRIRRLFRKNIHNCDALMAEIVTLYRLMIK